MKLQFIVLTIFWLALTGCAQQTESGVNNLNAAEFSKVISEKNGVVIDVRTPEELASGKIKDAVNFDIYDNFETQVQKLDKTTPVFVYCRSGGRSGDASHVLKKLGFQEVYNLEGGITSWKEEGYPVE